MISAELCEADAMALRGTGLVGICLHGQSENDLYELKYQMAVEFEDTLSSELVQPWPVRRHAPAPAQLMW